MEKWRFWERPGFGRALGFLGLGLLLGFLCAGILVRDWDMSTWPWLPTRWNWEVVAQPLATLGAGLFAVVAAIIALYNGDKTRLQDKEIHEGKLFEMQKQQLHDRFVSAIRLLSTKEDLTVRYSASVALTAIANSWADFYKDDKEAIQREFQKCINILSSQLMDEISTNPEPSLLIFKQNIQHLLLSALEKEGKNPPEERIDIGLDLRHCHLYSFSTEGKISNAINFDHANLYGDTFLTDTDFTTNISFTETQFHGEVYFNNSMFHSQTWFDEAVFHNEINFGDFSIIPEESKTPGELHPFTESTIRRISKELGADLTNAKFSGVPIIDDNSSAEEGPKIA